MVRLPGVLTRHSSVSHWLRFGYHPLVPESEPATAISAKRKSVFNATYVLPGGYLLLPL
jgi:hypothetical protein